MYLEGPGASPRSGLCEGDRGGKEVREAMRGQTVPSLRATVKTLHFIQDVMGAWALFQRQRGVEDFGARM